MMEVLGLLDLPGWFVLLVLFLVSAYMYGTWTFGAFNSTGIPGPKPYPFIGTEGPSFTKGIIEHDREMIQTYGKTVGMFVGRVPALLTTDEDLIKAVCVKEFPNFTDRRAIDGEEEMLTSAKGNKWRRLRHLLSPAFSTVKLKKMNYHIKRCARVFIENVEEYAKNGKPCEIKSVVFMTRIKLSLPCNIGDKLPECRRITQAFTIDTIAATVFGLEVNAQKNPDDPFVKMGKKSVAGFSVFNPALFASFFFPFLLPLLAKLNITFFPKDVMDFFSKVTESAIKERRKETKKEVDFLGLMMNAHAETETLNDVTDPAINIGISDMKTEKKSMTQQELLAQTLIFFVAGFETTAHTITFLCYHLAVNPQVQEKLYQEIKKHIGDKDTVDPIILSQLSYLDQCINETLRLYPPAIRTNRLCQNDITIKGINIKKDWNVVFPVSAMHRDPDLWHDPETFTPERFEDMSKIGYNFMPFGVGPRNCIGMRLALMEVKTAMTLLIKDYKLIRIDETMVPLKLHPLKFMLPVRPIEIGIERRS